MTMYTDFLLLPAVSNSFLSPLIVMASVAAGEFKIHRTRVWPSLLAGSVIELKYIAILRSSWSSSGLPYNILSNGSAYNHTTYMYVYMEFIGLPNSWWLQTSQHGTDMEPEIYTLCHSKRANENHVHLSSSINILTRRQLVRSHFHVCDAIVYCTCRPTTHINMHCCSVPELGHFSSQ